MGVYLRNGIYWYRFNWLKQQIRESTKQGNQKVTEQIERAHRTKLALGEVGIADRKSIPTLASFARERFMPWVKTEKANKPRTIAFYRARIDNLESFTVLWTALLDQIGPEHIRLYTERQRELRMKTSTINRGLATLRRCLNLAVELKLCPVKPVKITLLPGENQRERKLGRPDVS